MKRIQRIRDVKGYQHPPNTKYVGRPTKLGNPFAVVETNKGFIVTCENDQLWQIYAEFCKEQYDTKLEATQAAVGAYAVYARKFLKEEIEGLRNQNIEHLSCFCSLSQPCHVDVILDILNNK